jgi:hypothetical protein
VAENSGSFWKNIFSFLTRKNDPIEVMENKNEEQEYNPKNSWALLDEKNGNEEKLQSGKINNIENEIN